jgi:CRISPR/Cas system-associated protein Cas7 (RAMP superfamily)
MPVVSRTNAENVIPIMAIIILVVVLTGSSWIAPTVEYYYSKGSVERTQRAMERREKLLNQLRKDQHNGSAVIVDGEAD